VQPVSEVLPKPPPLAGSAQVPAKVPPLAVCETVPAPIT
jgi:hypothetical protein